MGSNPLGSEEAVLNIVGERVALGPLRKDLVPLFGRWRNDLGAARVLGDMVGPVTAEEEGRWYEEQVKAEDRVFFTIYEREALRPVGGTNLFGLDFRNQHAGFGIVIGEPEFRGRGLGTETTRLMLDYAFTALGLHNVMLTVFEFNPAGLRAYEKAGFRQIGRRRECRMMGGKVYDEIYMDCLAPEFERPVTPGKDWGLSAWSPPEVTTRTEAGTE
jgi:RimJ/RimL family protein N-acetyltransferase